MSRKAAVGVRHPTGPALTLRFLIPFAAAWLAVTIPLLTLGYGSDTDSWLVARVAEIFWQTHVYLRSRSSGFPLFEVSVSPLVHTGYYWAPNALALLGGISLLASLAALARQGKLRHPHCVLILVGFAPIILKNATCTADYVITLSILSWAYVALTAGRYTAGVVIVGIACGFRPQSIIYLAPTCLYILHQTRNLTKSFALAVLGVATALLVYSPVLLTSQFRIGYKDYGVDLTGQLLMAGYNGTRVLGIVPTVVLACVIVYAVRARRNGEAIGAHAIPHLRFHIGVLVTYGLVFLAMPHEPEYLLPALLSLVLVLDGLLERRLMIVVTCAVLSYHAFRIEALGGKSGSRELAFGVSDGFLVHDIEVRRFLLSTRDALTDFRPDRPTILMFGADWVPTNNPAWEAVEEPGIFRRKGTDFYVSEALIEKTIDAWRARGVRIVLWQGFAREFHLRNPADQAWAKIEVVPSLDEFLGARIEGQPMWPSE